MYGDTTPWINFNGNAYGVEWIIEFSGDKK